MRRSSRARVRALVAVAIPVLVAIFLVLVVGDEHRDDPSRWPRLLGSALAVAQGAALWWRGSRPERVMVATLAGAAAGYPLAPELVIPVAPLVALYALASTRSPRVSVPALVAVAGVTALSFLSAPAEDVQFALALGVVTWAVGEAARSRRAAIAEGARRAVLDEQARIARELHDVIAHSVSVIVVQAAAADDVFERRPDQVRAALRAIESTGRDALGELRYLLADVRPGQREKATRPQPGLDRLDDLAAPLRAAGLHVALRCEGAPRSLPAGVDLSAYRIVQEALTNTLRHAHATRAEVTVRYCPDAIEVDVRDDGRGVGATASGHGLVGMRERAAMLGGTLDAGPLEHGGYRVRVRLPLEAAT